MNARAVERRTMHEWGVILKSAPKGSAERSEPNMLLGFGWFDDNTAAPYPARFRTRREARAAIAARHGAGTYFAGRLRVVRLKSTFTWGPA